MAITDNQSRRCGVFQGPDQLIGRMPGIQYQQNGPDFCGGLVIDDIVGAVTR